MSQHDWEELLSAYADGEVTSAERSAVEALIDTTPEARTALAEIRALSQMLQALPQDPAPATVRTAALQAATRQATATPASQRFRAYRREWLAGLAAIAMTILVAGLLSLQFETAPSVADFNSDSLTPLAATDGREAVALRHRSGNEAVMVEDGVAATERASEKLLRTAAVAATAAPSNESADMPHEPKFEAAELDLVHNSLAGDDVVNEVERLREVLPYLRLQDESGQTIGNVSLVVVDAQRVANQFQVLLMQNGVRTVDARTVDFDADVAAVESATTSQPAQTQDLFAVYAEAPGEPLSKTLEELIKQREVLGLKLQPPLQVAQQSEPESRALGRATVADRKLNFKQLNDAYVVQQQDERLSEFAFEQPVSAADAIAESLGNLPADAQSHALDSREGARQLAIREARGQPMPASKATASNAPAPGQRSDPASPTESPQNLVFFNTLVKLQVPDPAEDGVNLGLGYQDQLRQNLRRETQAGGIPLAADAADFTSMRSRFARTAPDTVRVLFVLHPVSPAPALPPGSSPQPGR